MKVKIFWLRMEGSGRGLREAGTTREQPQGIEDEINAWLAENKGITVSSIQTSGWLTSTSAAASVMVTTVVYEEAKEKRGLKALG